MDFRGNTHGTIADTTVLATVVAATTTMKEVLMTTTRGPCGRLLDGTSGFTIKLLLLNQISFKASHARKLHPRALASASCAIRHVSRYKSEVREASSALRMPEVP